MNNIDLVEIEHKAHQWVTQVSVATICQKIPAGITDVQKYGLTNKNKVKLGQYICGALLDERNTVPLSICVAVWDQVFDQFAADVQHHDFPTKTLNYKTIAMEKVWDYLCNLYAQEMDVRKQINTHCTTLLEAGRPPPRSKI